jgi:hypothetical protein
VTVRRFCSETHDSDGGQVATFLDVSPTVGPALVKAIIAIEPSGPPFEGAIIAIAHLQHHLRIVESRERLAIAKAKLPAFRCTTAWDCAAQRHAAHVLFNPL